MKKNQLKKQATPKISDYEIGGIFIQKTTIEVWYDLFDVSHKAIIKLKDLVTLVSNKPRRSKNFDAGTFILANIYEVAGAYLKQYGAGLEARDNYQAN
jgi:hypothetical protein